MTRTMSEGRERLSEKDGESEIERHKGERRRESVIERHEAMKDRGGGGARGGGREINLIFIHIQSNIIAYLVGLSPSINRRSEWEDFMHLTRS